MRNRTSRVEPNYLQATACVRVFLRTDITLPREEPSILPPSVTPLLNGLYPSSLPWQ